MSFDNLIFGKVNEEKKVVVEAKRKVTIQKDDCSRCGRDKETCVNFDVPGGEVDILVVGESPVMVDAEAHSVYKSYSGMQLREVVKGTGLTVGYTYIVRCRGAGGKLPTAVHAKYCAKYTQSVIESKGAKVIVLAGLLAFKAVFPKSDFTKSVGNFMLKDNRVYFATNDAVSISRNHATRVHVQHFDRVKEYIEGKLFKNRKYIVIGKGDEELAEMAYKKICAKGEVSVDIEATGLLWYENKEKIYTVGVCIEEGVAFSFILTYLDGERVESNWRIVKQILQDKKISKVFHYGPFDIKMLEDYGLKVEAYTGDTVIAWYLLNENRTGYALKQLTAEELDGYENLVDMGEEVTDFNTMAYYNCEDVDNTFKLHKKSKESLPKELWKLYTEVLMPARRVLLDMEKKGVLIDCTAAVELEKTIDEKVDIIMQKVQEEYPEAAEKNLASSTDLRELFFNVYAMPVLGKTPSGAPALREETMNAYAKEFDFKLAEYILELRKYAKQKSTYVGKWPKIVHKDGRLHGLYFLTHTVTGRLASSDPNLQNVPRDSIIRDLFIAEKGKVFVQMDFSQAELRVAASLAKEKAMIEVYSSGIDLHTATAAQITGKPISEVLKEDRQKAKSVNFGFLYGATAKGYKDYAKNEYGIDVSLKQATEFRSRFFEKYAQLPVWYEEIKRELLLRHEVLSVFGRRRRFPIIPPVGSDDFASILRQAINFPVQSASSDCAMIVLVYLDKLVKKLGLDCAPVLTVHDSIVFEVSEVQVAEVVDAIGLAMAHLNEKVEFLQVRMDADIEVGPKWGSLKKYKNVSSN